MSIKDKIGKITVNHLTRVDEEFRYRIIKEYFITLGCYASKLDLQYDIWRCPVDIAENSVLRQMGVGSKGSESGYGKNNTGYILSHGETISHDVSDFFDALRCSGEVVAHELYIPRKRMVEALNQVNNHYKAVVIMKNFPNMLCSKPIIQMLSLDIDSDDIHNINREINKLNKIAGNAKYKWYRITKKTINVLIDSVCLTETDV